MTDPPEPFSQPVILCPNCDHGIDPHGVDPGDQCGVGVYNPLEGNSLCGCMWSPNDIAAVALENQRKELAEKVYDATFQVFVDTDGENSIKVHNEYKGLLMAHHLIIATNGG